MPIRLPVGPEMAKKCSPIFERQAAPDSIRDGPQRVNGDAPAEPRCPVSVNLTTKILDDGQYGAIRHAGEGSGSRKAGRVDLRKQAAARNKVDLAPGLLVEKRESGIDGRETTTDE